MNNRNDVFSQIVRGELPSFKIFENENILAILDIYPQVLGQCLIIPKSYQSGSFSQIETEVLKEMIEVAKKVALKIESVFPEVERCMVVIEGLEVDYAHIKIFPRRIESGFKEINSLKYPISNEELKNLQIKLNVL